MSSHGGRPRKLQSNRPEHNEIAELLGFDPKLADKVNRIIDYPSNKPVPVIEKDSQGRSVLAFKVLGPQHRKLLHSEEDAKLMAAMANSPEVGALALIHQRADRDPVMLEILELKRRGLPKELAKWLLLFRLTRE